MQLALYCPVYGYYEKETDIIGVSGDFYTSPSVGPLFGQLLACQFAEWLDCPEITPPVHRGDGTPPQQDRPLHQIVEAGAHDGTLAKDILTWIRQYHPPLFERLEYGIIEPSAFRRARQHENLVAFEGKVHWLESFGPATRNPQQESSSFVIRHSSFPSFSGVIFSNELLDAMPVHRLGWDARTRSWYEWGVEWDKDRFIWTRLPRLSAELGGFEPQFAGELLDVLPHGFVTEVPRAALEWWCQAAACLRQGKLLAIDYGFETDEFLLPERAEGTLRGYRRHRPVADLLSDPGEQDITAHVNFSLLKKAGESCGLVTESIQPQSRFLTGVLAKLSSGKGAFSPWTEQQTRQFQTLTHPDHLGRAFRVLVQSREAVWYPFTRDDQT